MAVDPSGPDSQIVSYSSSSVQSAAISRGGSYWVTSTTLCWIATGSNPTAAVATTGSMQLPANFPVQITVARDGWKIAVIRDTADGKLSIAPGGD